MGKLGGLALIATLALAGCAAPSVEPATKTVVVQPATVFDDSKVSEFVKDVRDSGTDYASMPANELANMAHELCEHYDGGFTTEDLRNSAGEKLAKAGEAAMATVCPPR
jgi:hypothetical protein